MFYFPQVHVEKNNGYSQLNHPLEMKLQLKAPRQACASIALPTSKSISNRALMIAALCGNEPQVLHPALCDDTAVMVDALGRQGNDLDIDVGAAGTAMRFRASRCPALAGRQHRLPRPGGLSSTACHRHRHAWRRHGDGGRREFAVHLGGDDGTARYRRRNGASQGRYRLDALHQYDGCRDA